MTDVVNEHADIRETKKAVLQRLKELVTAREQGHLGGRIRLILAELRNDYDGELGAEAEGLELRYKRSVFKDFADVAQCSQELRLSVQIDNRNDVDGHKWGALTIAVDRQLGTTAIYNE